MERILSSPLFRSIVVLWIAGAGLAHIVRGSKGSTWVLVGLPKWILGLVFDLVKGTFSMLADALAALLRGGGRALDRGARNAAGLPQPRRNGNRQHRQREPRDEEDDGHRVERDEAEN